MSYHAVRPGQIWADNDKRSEGRRLRVVRVTETHAVVLPASADPHRPGSGRTTRIRLDRFRPTSTGYRLIEDTEDLP